ncbi:hypothetical protein PybrP1_009494 [[Pythium] brassicae (nom. inval.)]|nr:hypothetical protein PybrP1_009494 [[Pythium] brassicae (nom. inval.)]
MGLVLTDAHGLVLKAEGDLAAQKLQSGFFASIAHTADALRDAADDDTAALPVVRLETSARVLMVTRSAGGERTLAVSKRRGLLNDE